MKCWRFLKRYKQALIFGLIMIMGFSLRSWRLGQVPMGLTWDEVAITYDAWGISLDGHDHWGTYFPTSFKSFGDYKAPVLPYMVALMLRLGRDLELAIREVALVFGTLMIGVTYFLAIKFTHSKQIAFLAMIFIAVSPWQIHLSRVGFEAGISATFLALGILFLFKDSKIFWVNPFISAVFFLLAFYSYHSVKVILIPVWLLLLTVLKKNKKWVMIQLLVLTVGLMPFISGWQTQITRANQTFSLTQIGTKVMKHFTWDFLLGGIDHSSRRNVVPGFGILTFYELGLIVTCLAFRFKNLPPGWWILGSLVFFGLIPSVLSQDSPHALRSTTILPYINILSAWSAGILLIKLKKSFRLLGKMFFCLSLSIYLGCFLKNYYLKYAFESAAAFQYGYKQVLEIVKKEGKKVDHIYMTNIYGEPYIYYLYYLKIKPKEFLSGGTANVTFGPIKEYTQKNSLYIASPLEIEVPSISGVVATINYPRSSKLAFIVVKTP